MRRKLLILVAVVVVLSLVIAVPVGAKKPLPKFLGEMDLELQVTAPPGVAPPPCTVVTGIGVCSCSDGSVYTWRGTVDPDGDGPLEYNMAFINLRTARANPSGIASPFNEIWAIYAGEVATGDNGCPSTDAATIWGFDSGLSNLGNNTYRMNGDVVSATGDFAGWEGRKVHMSGTFDFGTFPIFTAPGTFRLN